MNGDMLHVIKKAEVLIEALPYMQKFAGKTVVVKYGGNAMISPELKNAVMDDIILLKYIGLNPVLIHGGGPEITDMLGRFDIESSFVNGLRVTDAAAMEVVQMVLAGKTNKEVVSLLNRKGARAVGICGIDGSLIECEKMTEDMDGRAVDLGYVGRITRVNSKILDLFSRDEYIPVVAPVGAGADGQSYNINADTAAAEIAGALKAEKLILLTDVDGVRMSPDSGEAIPVLTSAEALELIRTGVINKGMIPKVLSCLDAIEAGVSRATIIDGRVPHCVLLEIFTNRGIGTMFVPGARQ